MFTCNLGLAGFFSKYLERAINERTTRISNDPIKIPEAEDRIIKAYLGWLQTGVIDQAPLLEPLETQDPLLCEKLWVFGDKIMSLEFCNMAMRILHRKYHSGRLLPVSVDYIYQRTDEASWLRKMIVEAFMFYAPSSQRFPHSKSEKAWEPFTKLSKCAQFPDDVLARMSRAQRRPTPFSINGFLFGEKTGPWKL